LEAVFLVLFVRKFILKKPNLSGNHLLLICLRIGNRLIYDVFNFHFKSFFQIFKITITAKIIKQLLINFSAWFFKLRFLRFLAGLPLIIAVTFFALTLK